MYKLPSLRRMTRLVCGLAAAGALTLGLSGCGDTFRPIVIPNTPPGVDPGTQREAVVLTESPNPPGSTPACANGATPPCPGMMMQINVGGDTNSSGFTSPGDLANYVVGRGPIRGTFGVALPQQFWMVNRDSDSVTTITPSLGTSNTVALPAGAKPVSLAVANDPNAASGTSNDLILTANSGLNSVTFVDASARIVRLTTDPTVVPMNDPVSIVGISAGRKAYVVNEGSNTVSVISTVDGSTLAPPIAVGTDPVQIVTNNGASLAYVVNRGSGDVTVINTGNDTVAATIPTGAGASFAAFDSKLLRLYVTNPTANTVAVIDASSGAGTLLRTVTMPAGASNPMMLAALPDGTRFYTLNSATDNVTVFDAQSFAAKTNIPVGTNPTWIAASGDSSRVYVTNHDSTVDASGNVIQPAGTTIIRTVAAPNENPPKSADTVVTTLAAPLTDPQSCTAASATCLRQQPTFVISQ